MEAGPAFYIVDGGDCHTVNFDQFHKFLARADTELRMQADIIKELIDVNYWEDPRYKLVLDDLE